MPQQLYGERYVIVSADCHGGGDLHEYREFLDPAYREDFDAWAATYEVPYEDLRGPDGARNWDSDRRLSDLENDGIVAEVIYPNTVPPFFPHVSLTAQPPAANSGDLARRWAGLQAHNRWLADFCAKAPGRRAGIVQVMLHDIPAAVAEVQWAARNGMTGGVLLPGAPPGSGIPPLYDVDYYEPLFAACEELGMPLNHHSGSAVPAAAGTEFDHVILLLEVTWWAHRALSHLMVSGALERHPGLNLVFTEQGTAWIPDELTRLEFFFHRMRTAVGAQEYEWGAPVMAKLSLSPREYWDRQCYVGSSFIRPAEVPLRHAVGVDKIMWGSDYPHKEASFPYSTLALRAAFADVDPTEVQAMLGGNAARLYGLDLEALAPLAAKVGPSHLEVAQPLEPGEVPAEADRCPAFFGLTAPAGS